LALTNVAIAIFGSIRPSGIFGTAPQAQSRSVHLTLAKYASAASKIEQIKRSGKTIV